MLANIGAPATQANIDFLDKWQRFEGGTAAFNPLNTTQPAPGASSYNSVGVRNYTSPAQGALATGQTLLNGRYNHVVAALRSGDAASFALRDPIGVGQEVNTWGTTSFGNAIKSRTPVSAAGVSVGQDVAGAVSAVGSAATRVPGVQQALDVGSFLGRLTDPAFILRGVELVGGGLLVLLGLYLLARQVGLGVAEQSPAPVVAAAARVPATV